MSSISSLVDKILSPRENIKLEELYSTLLDSQETFLVILNEDTEMQKVRFLFDGVIRDFTALKDGLDKKASIVQSIYLETSIFYLQKGRDEELSDFQRSCISSLKKKTG